MGEKEEESEAKRVLSVRLMILMAVGGIFGGGLYGMSGTMIGLTGDAVWLPMIILFCISLFDALTYMEFAACYPKMASTYIYMKEGFGGKAGEGIAWTVNMYNTLAAPMSSVFITMTGAGYLQSFFSIFHIPDPGLIAITFVLWTAALALQAWGIKQSVILGDIMTIIELSMVSILMFIGFAFPTRTPNYFAWPTIAGLAQTLAMARFAYGGYATPCTYIEEAVEPAFKNVWRACIGSLAYTLFGYTACVVAMVRMNPPSVIAFAANPFVAATAGVLGGIAPIIFAVLGTPSAYNGALFGMGTRARILAGMAAAGDLPKSIFGRWWKARGTPIGALIATYLIGLPFVFIGRFAWLVLATAASGLVTMGIMGAAYIAFSVRKVIPDEKKEWHVPSWLKMGIGFPGVVTVGFVLFCSIYQDPNSWLPSGIFMGLAAGMYIVWTLMGKKLSVTPKA